MSIINSNAGISYKNLLNDTDAVLDSATIQSLTVTDTLDITTADLIGIPDNLHATTYAEVDQINNINNVAISNTEWGYLGALDQSVSTTSNVTFNSLTVGTLNLTNLDLPGYLHVDTIDEHTANAGVTIEGILHKDSQIYIDVINEKTVAAGVLIDGVLLKDQNITVNNILPAGTSITIGSAAGCYFPGPVFTNTLDTYSGSVLTVNPNMTIGALKTLKANTIDATTSNGQILIGNSTGGIRADGAIYAPSINSYNNLIVSAGTTIDLNSTVNATRINGNTTLTLGGTTLQIGNPYPETSSSITCFGNLVGYPGIYSQFTTQKAPTSVLSPLFDAYTANAQIIVGNATGGISSPGTLIIATGKKLNTDTIDSTTANGQISIGNATGGIACSIIQPIGTDLQLSAPSGRVITSRLPYGMYQRKAAQVIGTGAVTQIAWDTTAIQSFLSRAGNVITVTNGGVYTVSMGVNWVTAGINSRRLANIQQNGADISRSETYENSASPYMSQCCTITQIFAAGDTITGTVYQDSGANVTIAYGAGVQPYIFLSVIYHCN